MPWGEEHKLFVGGLSWDTTDDKLWEAFSKFGDISFHRVCTDRESGQSRGFGFVSFGTKEAADKAIADMDGTELDGRSIQCNMAQPKGDSPKKEGGGGSWGEKKSWGGGGGGGGGGGWGEPEFKVFCGNLSWNTYSDELKAAFGECEGLLDAFVCTDKETQESRGFGFAKFDSEENMNKAVAALNGKEVDGRAINCNPARPKGEAPPNGGKKLCHAFQKGECWRGDDCKFVHELEADQPGAGGGDAAPAVEENKQKKSFGDDDDDDDDEDDNDDDDEDKEEEAVVKEKPKKKKKKKVDGDDGAPKKKKKKKKVDGDGDDEAPKKKKKAKKADAEDGEEAPKKKKKKKKAVDGEESKKKKKNKKNKAEGPADGEKPKKKKKKKKAE